MKVKDIIQQIETHCPLSLAYDWDNSGLLIGNPEASADKIAVTLDVTMDTARQAIEWGADLIVAHHPLIFSPMKRITANEPQGQLVLELIQNHVSVYAAHTNMDTAKEGINARLAALFELGDTRIVDVHTPDVSAGLGRVGVLPQPMTVTAFADIVKEKLHTPFVRVCGDLMRTVRTAAVLSGSCSEFVEKAASMGADVIVTGDLKYHECLDFVAAGICVIDAGHFPTERLVVDIFRDMIGKDVKILEQKDVFTCI